MSVLWMAAGNREMKGDTATQSYRQGSQARPEVLTQLLQTSDRIVQEIDRLNTA